MLLELPVMKEVRCREPALDACCCSHSASFSKEYTAATGLPLVLTLLMVLPCLTPAGTGTSSCCWPTGAQVAAEYLATVR
jgi:hypothetical protein